MQRRVIFLDIDGVLNTAQYVREANDVKVMNPANVAIVRRLVETTQAGIVISSSWRHRADWEEYIRHVFSQSGWDSPPIVDRIPEQPGGRGREIAVWLEKHLVENFVIVDDDMHDMLPEQQEHLIYCDSNLGFTALNAEEVERLWA